MGRLSKWIESGWLGVCYCLLMLEFVFVFSYSSLRKLNMYLFINMVGKYIQSKSIL